MPFDSEGIFTRIHNWEDDRVNDIEIVSDSHDEEDDNFASGLSQTVLRDGRAAMTGNLNMAAFQIKNVGNGVFETDAINKGQLDAVDASAVHLADEETITGVKTFEVSPHVPTADDDTDDTTAASTAFVKKVISNQTFKTALLDWLTPDYENGAAVTSGSSMSSGGYLVVRASGNDRSSWVNIGSVQVFNSSWGANYGSPDNATYIVGKGDVVTFQGVSITFYPFKGA